MLAVGAAASLLVAGGLWYVFKRSQGSSPHSLLLVDLDDLVALPSEKRSAYVLWAKQQQTLH